MVCTAYLTWLLPLMALEAAAQSMLCSTTNTASSGANSSIYQTRSACVNSCKGQSAYAVVQYDKCWCSNATPSSTTDGGSCNKPCPGYPSEMCGGDGQYSYVLLDKSKISAASSSSASSSQQQEQQPPSSSLSSSESSYSSNPSEQPSSPSPQIVTVTQTNSQGSQTIIKTVQASPSKVEGGPVTFQTVTVTGTAAVSTVAASSSNTPLAAPEGNGGSGGLKQGAIAGIAVGGSAAGVFLGMAALMLWRRRRYSDDDDGAHNNNGRRGVVLEDEGGYFGPMGTTTIRRDNTSASEDSRMEAFGQNKNLCRNSIGSLEDTSSESNQVLRVVNPDIPEKQ